MEPALPLAQVGPYLEDRARKNAPVFYSDLARHFGLPRVTEYWSAHPLCELFCRLDEEDHTNRRPFRTALVISMEFSIPGDGFFKTLHDLRGTPHPLSDDQKIQLWKKEYDDLIKYYEQP